MLSMRQSRVLWKMKGKVYIFNRWRAVEFDVAARRVTISRRWSLPWGYIGRHLTCSEVNALLQLAARQRGVGRITLLELAREVGYEPGFYRPDKQNRKDR